LSSRPSAARTEQDKPRPTAAVPCIQIRGASVHNLKSVDIDIPRDALTVITGVSGSGKSSLAFDTLYAEGQRQYIDSLSAYARQFLDQLARPEVDSIDGLAPTLAIDQRVGTSGGRSTVATVTEIYDYLRLLYARVGVPHCCHCGSRIAQQSSERIRESLLALPENTKVVLLAPMVRGRKGYHRDILNKIQKSGLVRARVDGEYYAIEEVPELAPRKNHTIEAVVDRLVIRKGVEARLTDSLLLSLKLGQGVVTISKETQSGVWSDGVLSTLNACLNCGASFDELEPRTFSFNSPYGACSQCDGLGMLQDAICSACKGARLRPEALAVTINELSIDRLLAKSLKDSRVWVETVTSCLGDSESLIARPIQREVIGRLSYLEEVGVGYLTLDRPAETLSGGEMQRVRLATSLGSGLVGVCYVLDEPSIGLHPADHDRLIGCIQSLRKAGNTVVIVEHDEATMLSADFLIDMGPGAGEQGGAIISKGTPEEVIADPASITGRFLSGKEGMRLPKARRSAKDGQQIVLREATLHNLKSVTAEFPLGCFIGVSGVSGSGKSTLINDTLYPAIAERLGLKTSSAGPFRELLGCEEVDKLVPIDQSPIGRSSRSCPATYSGVMDEIRQIFASTRVAKARGFGANRFSFNSSSGQCELCKGHGEEKIEMNFLSDLSITCSRCGGKRFNRQTLQVRFKGLSVADVLNLSVDQAAEVFESIPKISRLLESLQKVGLGYLHLGQSSKTLSGGEAQRIKLGSELAKRATGRTLYLLDEPTTGLHFADVRRLIAVLDELVEGGNTVIVIEHQFDLLASCDWLIDMGPEGGEGGGNILGMGTPERVARLDGSATGFYLRKILEKLGKRVDET
jgi:excinuclease ABC subunit A